MIQTCCFDSFEVILGYPRGPMVLQYGKRGVMVDVLAESEFIHYVAIVEALEETGCYPWLRASVSIMR